MSLFIVADSKQHSNLTMLPARHQHFGSLVYGLLQQKPVDIRKVTDKAGHLSVGGCRLLTKYGSGASKWNFTFRPEDLQTMIADRDNSGAFSYICLVCGSNSICVLRSGEVFDLLDATEKEKSQTIRVHKKAGCCLRVTSSASGVELTIPANRFPALLISEE